MPKLQIHGPMHLATVALTVISVAILIVVAVNLSTAPTLGQGRGNTDHIGNFNFRVEIDGVDAGQFQEVSGLSVELEVIEFREGSDDTGEVRKIPGRAKYGNITLKRGYVPGGSFTEWVESSLTAPDADPTTARKNGSIVIYDQQGSPVARYSFTNAWPSKWELHTTDEGGREVLTEEITIVVEHIERG